MNDLPPLTGRWFELENRAVFRLTGPDQVRYLNGQVTNDVARATEESAIPACLCTLKGKVEALIWIRRAGDAILIDGEGPQRAALAARLERYLIADDCEIEDLSGKVRIFHHFAGESVGGSASTRLEEPGRDWIMKAGDEPAFWKDHEIPAREWALREILSRLPRSGHEITSEEFPAELGLDTTAVDFHKGCYLGQEVISRIRSIGRVKRFLRTVESPRPLVKGDTVTAPSGENGKVTRSSIRDDAGREMTLALFSVPDPASPLAQATTVAVS